MYLKFYNLRQFPFSTTCEEEFFFKSEVHKEALANMMYTVEHRKGMALISGEVGSGKTFMGNMLRRSMGARCLCVMLNNPPQHAKQLLLAVARKISARIAKSSDKISIAEELETALKKLFERGRLVAVILDEAQDLSASALGELRLMWNLEMNGQRLVQIVLIGQPELRERIQEPQWEPLRQRIVLSYHLRSLSADDTTSYIMHRLNVAGDGQCGAEFTPTALADIYAATEGVPRLINILCDNALLVGYARGVTCIDRVIVSEVLRDMTCWGVVPSDQPMHATATLMAG